LFPMEHRSTEVRQDLVVLRARDALVSVRTQLINTTRGLVKSMGTRLPKCSSPSFAHQVEEALPAEVRESLLPLVRLAEALSDCIQVYDERIEKLGQEKYRHTELLRQVKGVGPLTSLAYVLTLENPDRFAKSRDVGPYLGLVPKQEDSGDSQPQLGISKAGDVMLRRLLVGSAHYILGPFGPDTDLRRYGLRLCERGGKNAKKRAAVAVARKLAVLLHRLWISGEVYEPLRHAPPTAEVQEAA
jgi:transposase